jgi:multicomponent K+:H+ antiporter subunit C
MEIIVAITVGVLTATGVYLLLRNRTFPVILGLILITYAVNLFLFASGGIAVDQPPVIKDDAAGYSDPVPQALVLTAIVISFGMTALIVVLSLRTFLETDSDDVSFVASPDADQELEI